MSYTPTQLGQQLIKNIGLKEYMNLQKLLTNSNGLIFTDSKELKNIADLKITNTGLRDDGTRFYTLKAEYFRWS